MEEIRKKLHNISGKVDTLTEVVNNLKWKDEERLMTVATALDLGAVRGLGAEAPSVPGDAWQTRMGQEINLLR